MVIKSKPSNPTDELLHDLNSVIQGDVRFDQISRALWSTDASIYQIEPLGIVLPKNDEDVIGLSPLDIIG